MTDTTTTPPPASEPHAGWPGAATAEPGVMTGPTELFALAAAIWSLLVLVVFAILTTTAGPGPATPALLVYFVVGVSSIGIQLAPHRFPTADLTMLAIGFFTWPLVGLLLIEAHLWFAGPVLMWLVLTVGTCCHVWAVRLHWRQFSELLARGRGAVERGWLEVALVGTGAGVALITAFLGRGDTVQPGGLPTTLPLTWLLGVLLLVIGLKVSSMLDRRVAGPAFGLVAVLAISPALTYTLPRFVWTQKHIGVVDLFLHNGHVIDSNDLYQAWPSMFAGMAWIADGAGAHNAGDLQTVAAWWPILINLAVLVVVRRLALNFDASPQRAWLAGVLAVLGISVGQDYFSPQSLAFVASLIVLALVTRPRLGPRDWPSGVEGVLVMAGALTVVTSHQLTPFMLTVYLAVLSWFGRSRFGWALPASVALLTLGWTGIHAGVVTQHWSFDDVGNLFANVSRPSGGHNFAYDQAERLSTIGLAAAPLVVGLLGLFGWFQRRDQSANTLLVCAASSALIVVGVDYGNEGMLRATMFAVPWFAVLAVRWHDNTRSKKVMRLTSCFITVPVVTAAYVSATTGFDYVNVVRPSDLTAERAFEQQAPDGSTLIFVDQETYVSVSTTNRYPRLRYDSYEVRNVFSSPKAVAATTVLDLDSRAAGIQRKTSPAVYAIATIGGSATGKAYGLWTAAQYQATVQALNNSSRWRVVFREGESILFRYLP